MLEPQLALLRPVQGPSRGWCLGSRGGPRVTGRGGSLACGESPARMPTPSEPSVGERASRREGKRPPGESDRGRLHGAHWCKY